jgi:hypothetical protein
MTKILVHLKEFGPIHIINWGTCFVFANEEIIWSTKINHNSFKL